MTDDMMKSELRRHLDELARLAPHWDGEHAPRIDPAIIDAARRVVEHLPDDAPRPMVVPLSAGTLQFEWHAGDRVLEVEIATPANIHYLKWDPDRGPAEENVCPTEDAETLTELIRWFVRPQ